MTSWRCGQARKAWSEQFDGGARLAAEHGAHLSECEGCRDFIRLAEVARSCLRSVSYPAADLAADRALLQSLRIPEGAAAAPAQGGQKRILRWRRNWVALAVAGFASFSITLGAARILSSFPTATEAGPTVGVHAPASSFLANRIGLWSGSETLPSQNAPNRTAPRPPRGNGKRKPSERAGPSGRAGFQESSIPLG